MDEKLIARFWNKVDKSGECWIWTAARNERGYGLFHIRAGQRFYAHRFSYSLRFGTLGDLCVLHRCDNPRCVRPDHLFLGTRGDNMRDMTAKGRRLRGARNGASKLTEDAVAAIRARLAHAPRGEAARVAREYGVAPSVICRVRSGKIWRHV